MVRSVLSTVFTDEPWRDLGFPRRPRAGRFFRRFQPDWRVALEDIAFQEIVAILTAAHIKAASEIPPDLTVLLNLLLDGPEGEKELWQPFGYPSREEGSAKLGEALAAYSTSSAEDWPGLLVSRLGVQHVPNRNLAAALFVGAARLAHVSEHMVWQLRDAPSAERPR